MTAGTTFNVTGADGEQLYAGEDAEAAAIAANTLGATVVTRYPDGLTSEEGSVHVGARKSEQRDEPDVPIGTSRSKTAEKKD